MTKVMKKPTPRNCADIIKSGSINEEKVEFVSRERLVCDTNVADNIYPCTENYKNDDKNDGCVLLTGCTGFIGSYILKSLLAMGIPKIYCLVRADSEESGAKRIYDVMEKYRIAYAYDDSRIEVVCGNLEESMLGMSADRYDELSDKVSVIYHNGAKVDFLYTYDMLKKANVEGTHEIMKFAVNKRNKLLNYISSAAVLSAVKESETNEKTDIKNNPPEISGYNQSKWVSDVMISKAMERGVNCNIFRLGTASGASDTGCCQVKDFAWLVIKMCINAGYCTDFNIDLNLTPVDIMADSISTIGNNSDNYSGNVYHIFNNKSISISEIFDWVSEYGYHIEKVPFDIWCLQINNYLNNSDDDELKAVYSIIYNSSEMSEELEDYETEKPVMKSDETIRMLFQSGIKMQSVSKEQFFNTIRYFVETGFLKEK
jgi:thioester reductase-like protein